MKVFNWWSISFFFIANILVHFCIIIQLLYITIIYNQQIITVSACFVCLFAFPPSLSFFIISYFAVVTLRLMLVFLSSSFEHFRIKAYLQSSTYRLVFFFSLLEIFRAFPLTLATRSLYSYIMLPQCAQKSKKGTRQRCWVLFLLLLDALRRHNNRLCDCVCVVVVWWFVTLICYW